MNFRLIRAFLVLCLCFGTPAIAQDIIPIAVEAPEVGPETNLPLPRFVSVSYTHLTLPTTPYV